jgi:SAM-dependent methyltransferase
MSAMSTVHVDPSNAEALRAWDGADGAYWAENEAAFDAGLERHDRPFFEAAAIGATDRVLDIGCGNGQTTREAARRASHGAAFGVDLSSQMIERARLRAAEQGITNVRFLQADAQIHPFDEQAFDVAISRTGAMFFGNPVAAFANIARVLRPGGRLVLLTWQELSRNHWVRDFLAAVAAGRDLPAPPPDAPGPFSLALPDRVHEILTAAGYTDVCMDGVEEPIFFGPTAEEAFRFVRGLGLIEFLLRDLDDTARAQAVGALRATIEAHATPNGVLYPSAAWIVLARRV